MDRFYIQPKYFSDFSCIGGECPESCCSGWNIEWKYEEFQALRAVNCTDELAKRIYDSFMFVADGRNCYSIKMCEDGNCPFHNRETGLCDIQKSVGEEYLGVICRQYPRLFVEHDEQIIRWCTTSCPAVIDILFDHENATDIEKIQANDLDDIDHSTFTVDDPKTVESDPIKQMRIVLFDFYTDMLLDKSRDLETSIILTALAVKHFSDAESKGDYQKLPQMTRDLKRQLNDPAVARSLDDLKPNYQLKFKLVNNMLVKFFGNSTNAINISALHDGEMLNVESYLKGIENFNNAFDNKLFILKNIIINTFFDLNMPVGKFKRSLFENYAYFVLSAAAMKTVAASIGFSSANIKEDFKACVSEMSRVFSHSLKLGDLIIEDMKQIGLTSPAHLALIIK